MAKGTGKKRSKKAADAPGASRNRAVRLEKALAAGLKREAKAASRLEAARIEVAVLRMALAEVVGEESPESAPVAVPEVVSQPAPKAPAAPKAAPAKAAPAKAAPARPAAGSTRAPRGTRSRPANGASDR